MGENITSRDIVGLSLLLRVNSTEDIALIFAEPSSSDLENLLQDKFFIELIEENLRHKPVSHSSNLKDEAVLESLENGEVNIDGVEDDGDGVDGVDDGDYGDNRDDVDLDYKEEEEEMKDEDASCDKRKRRRKKREENDTELPVDKISETEFSCQLCQKVLNCYANARRHVKVHGIGVEPVEDRTCPYCNRVFKYATLCRLHLKRTCNIRNNPVCKQCDKIFDNRGDLNEHIKREHNEDDLKCRYCDLVASRVEARIKHENGVHLNMKCDKCKKVFDNEDQKENHNCDGREPFHCEECGKYYVTKSTLKLHIENVHRGVKHPCHLCTDVLSTKLALERHVRNVHVVSVKNFKCDICGAAFKDREYLVRHEKLIHSEAPKSDPCPQCGKVMRNKRNLMNHIRQVHEKNFKHTCEDCGKRFRFLNLLQNHAEMAHMKGTLHMCQLCGKECIGKKRLHNHMQRKHPKDQKFANCQHCDKEVPLTQMKSHVYEVHKMHAYKFQCEYCHKRFDTKSHIRVHLRKHTKARPYFCRGCGVYFRDLMIIKKHIRLCHNSDFTLSFYDVTKDVMNPYTS